MWLFGLIFIAITALTKCSDADLTVEAAFQGRCGHGSPCEQLCYEIHDGMYECDCTEGYELNKDGYSCQEINSTFLFPSALPSTNSDSSFSSDNIVTITKNSLLSKTSEIKNRNNKNIKNSLKKSYSDDDEIYDDDDDDDDEADDDYNSITTTKTTNINNKFVNKYINNNNNNNIKNNYYKSTLTTTTSEPLQQKSLDDFYSKEDLSVYDDVNNNKLNLRNSNNDNNQLVTNTINSGMNVGTITTTVPTVDAGITTVTSNDNAKERCTLDCGFEGTCQWNKNGTPPECVCPFGKTGPKCSEDMKINTPRFTSKSWIAFPALRGAYKHVQLHIEFRPESFDGIILLTGERDDLTGDFMAVLIHQGFIEFWFDCGSGTGVVRSEETVILNQWNTVLIYRHRWDSWLILNQGNRVQGRSKGLFSRITFREPVFLGGIGNITGLNKKLPVTHGMTGCVRKFVANEHEYNFQQAPYGDVSQGFNILECTTDRCSRFPCRHGGKCISSDDGTAVCLCPLGFGGDLCEMRLDLQVPSFNGSSYLRYAPLGDSAIIWLDIQVILKPQQDDGLLLYSGHHEYGDYISLCLNMGFVEFTYDLGSGPATLRSDFPLTLNQWHKIHISRTARLAVLKIDQLPEVTTISPNGFWHLSLPHSLFLGGVHNIQTLPTSLREKGSFIGCIQKFVINERPIAIISEALGGSNVDNCPHACVARPCGLLAQCIPNLENYECECNPHNNNAQLCNKAEEVPVKVLEEAVIAAAAHNNTTEMTTLIETDTTIADILESVGENEEEEDDNNDGDIISSNKNKDYYYNDNENDDEDYEGSGMTARTSATYETTVATQTPSTTLRTITTTIGKQKEVKTPIKSPYKEMIEDIESHYTLKGKYMLLDSTKRLTNKRKSKKAFEHNLKKKKQKHTNYISSDFIFNTNDMNDDEDNSVEDVDQTRPKQHHTMRYRPEDDTIIDEILIDEMDKIMKDSDGDNEKVWKTYQPQITTVSPSTNSPQLEQQRAHTGACFNGHDSYFHYSDAETMRRVISYQIDLNLRFKTHSNNGLILWSGRHSAQQDDDFLSLGIEEGFLHLRYNLGSGEVNIEYNTTVVSDGLWHRIRAVRNLQEGTLKVDGGKPIVQRSPGKLRQLNTDAGLYVGGMPDPLYYTRNRYPNGILGCISEVVLAGELKLDFDVTTCLDCAHNVEPGIL